MEKDATRTTIMLPSIAMGLIFVLDELIERIERAYQCDQKNPAEHTRSGERDVNHLTSI